jgi:hypothetical protein
MASETYLLKEEPVKRPAGVTIFAVMSILSGTSASVHGLLTIGSVFSSGVPSTSPTTSLWLELLPGIGRLVLGGIFALIGIGLWRMQRWARSAFIGWTMLWCMVLIGFLVLNEIGTEIWMPPTLFVLLLLAYGALSLCYVVQRGVKDAFRT